MPKIKKQKPDHVAKQQIGNLKDALAAAHHETFLAQTRATVALAALEISRQGAMLDPLLGESGTLTRKAGEVELTKIHAATLRDKNTYAVLFFDLDHFKNVNDTHSHAAGDEALKHVSALLNEYVREGDWVFRYGGEEIGVILPNCPDLETAMGIAEGLRARLAATTCDLKGTSNIGTPDIKLTTSIGVALSAGCNSFQQVVDRADQAVYKAKGKGDPKTGQPDDADGRNRVCGYVEEHKFVIIPRSTLPSPRTHDPNRPTSATPTAGVPAAAPPAPAG